MSLDLLRRVSGAVAAAAILFQCVASCTTRNHRVAPPPDANSSEVTGQVVSGALATMGLHLQAGEALRAEVVEHDALQPELFVFAPARLVADVQVSTPVGQAYIAALPRSASGPVRQDPFAFGKKELARFSPLPGIPLISSSFLSSSCGKSSLTWLVFIAPRTGDYVGGVGPTASSPPSGKFTVKYDLRLLPTSSADLIARMDANTGRDSGLALAAAADQQRAWLTDASFFGSGGCGR